MRDRARLLSEHGARADAGWLDALEGTWRKRHGGCCCQTGYGWQCLRIYCDGSGPFPVPEFALSGGPEAWLDEGPALAAEDEIRANLLVRIERQDAADGRTHSGPHRTDLDVRHARRKRARLRSCSTGEQKALLIGLVLAHARMQAVEQGRCPVLLLDEVAAHLDQERRQALFDLMRYFRHASLVDRDGSSPV